MFTAVTLDLKYVTFIIHVASISSFALSDYLSYRPQIASLIPEEIPIKILTIIDSMTNMVTIYILVL